MASKTIDVDSKNVCTVLAINRGETYRKWNIQIYYGSSLIQLSSLYKHPALKGLLLMPILMSYDVDLILVSADPVRNIAWSLRQGASGREGTSSPIDGGLFQRRISGYHGRYTGP